jgi:hypothetical protein
VVNAKRRCGSVRTAVTRLSPPRIENCHRTSPGMCLP